MRKKKHSIKEYIARKILEKEEEKKETEEEKKARERKFYLNK